ncbi:hypothetical protein BC939DRAFT_441000 [Gamsiella multidivaricata]|uniref:uncharacterized protein n=1 Tax=Gamsiella multidivaricata TaxID=101098 RepID=UPI0022205AAE|nr:uncharacterized protein BC939DRAFT_441000 [Gamsiella multidivaricata]KAI7829532.1 hypothetical protein BC939DRAFT_441000 [Gamsiella multidivaricata]
MLTMVAREVAPARHCPWEAEVEPRSEFGNLDHSDDCLPKEKKRIESDRFSCSAQPTTPTPSPVYTCALLPPSSSQELSRALAHAQSLNTTASFGPSKTVSVSLSRNRNRNRNNLRRGSIARLAPEENSTLSSTDATEALMGSSTSWASATASWRSISTTLTALLLRFTPMQHSSGGFSHWVV